MPEPMKVKPDPDAEDLPPKMEWITRQLYRLGDPKVSWNLGSSLTLKYLTNGLQHFQSGTPNKRK